MGAQCLVQQGLICCSSSGGRFIAGLAWNGHSPALRPVLELPVTAAGRNQDPTVVGKRSKDVADLHLGDYEAGGDPASNRGLTLKVTGPPTRCGLKIKASAGGFGSP